MNLLEIIKTKATVKTFLGGTCRRDIWRDLLSPLLRITFCNPVLPDGTPWDDSYMESENQIKDESDVLTFILTPASSSYYSMYEIGQLQRDVKGTNKKIIFGFLPDTNVSDATFSQEEIESFAKVGKNLQSNGHVFLNNKCPLNSSKEELIIKLAFLLNQ